MHPMQAFLIDSIKQKQGYYQNVIKAQHPYPCSSCQKNVNANQKSIFVLVAITGFTLNVMGPLLVNTSQ